jgi:hypothetical protein
MVHGSLLGREDMIFQDTLLGKSRVVFIDSCFCETDRKIAQRLQMTWYVELRSFPDLIDLFFIFSKIRKNKKKYLHALFFIELYYLCLSIYVALRDIKILCFPELFLLQRNYFY